MDARALVAALLEGDEDLDFSMDYIERASYWHHIHLIATKEWRSYFRSLGWRVRSLYQHKAAAKRRFAYLSLTLEPLDGHQCDIYDAHLLGEYIYEFMEKRLNKNRYDLNIDVQSHFWSANTYGGLEQYSLPPGTNRVDVTLAVANDGYYNTFHPLNGVR